MKTQTFPVLDMMCAVCANSVESILNQAVGVEKANVNYASHKVTITFDPQITSAEKLKKIVIKAGYDLLINNISEEKISDKKNEKLQKLRRNFWASFIISLPIFVIAMFHLHFIGHEFVQGILCSFSVFWFGNRFLIGAWKQLKNRSANMDTLVAISTLVAYLFSWANIFFENFWKSKGIEPHLYFESASVVITFILLGKLLEENAKEKTTDAIKKLMELTPSKVFVKINEKWKEIPIEKVQKGDILLVKPGQKIAVDGKIIQGESYIDESMITGEPIAVAKTQNDRVFAGTINQLGSLEMEAQKIGNETLVAQITQSVQEAQNSKAPIQNLVDKVAKYFVPTIIFVAVFSWILWSFSGVENGFSIGLQTFVTTLVIACPCALGLATPTAIMVGMGKGAENGILIKNAESLELTSKINTIVLDKTGTITQGKPSVLHWIFEDENKNLPILLSLEEKSQHPMAQSIIKKWANIPKVEITDFTTILGQGIKGKFQEKTYQIGNFRWINSGIEISEKFREKIKLWSNEGSLICFSDSNKMLGLLVISDSIKETSKEAIKKLQLSGIELHILTGDDEKTAQNIAKKIGISSVKAQVTPDEKQQFIKKLQQQGKIVAMVGDGINDSQALAQAQVSIAMGTGNDIAMEVAQVTLMNSDLTKIPKVISLSEKIVRTIRQNLFWAFIYNIISVPIAAGVLYFWFNGLLLNPMIASMAMTFSSLSVLINSLLIKKIKL